MRTDGAHFTVDTFARYFVHDPVHHVADVEENYRRLSTTRAEPPSPVDGHGDEAEVPVALGREREPGASA